MADVINMTPALKGSYDLKKFKKDQRSMRKGAREKMRLAQEEFLVRTKPTSMDAFLPNKKTLKGKKY